jgi:hypothetical protein
LLYFGDERFFNCEPPEKRCDLTQRRARRIPIKNEIAKTEQKEATQGHRNPNVSEVFAERLKQNTPNSPSIPPSITTFN